MVRESKLSFDDQSHPYLFDEFPGFYATWEADDNFGEGIDLPATDATEDSNHKIVQSLVQVDEEERNLQKCQPKTLCSPRHLAGADWMNDPKDS